MFNGRNLAAVFRALGTIALINTTVVGSSALAQQPQSAGALVFKLFEGDDSVDPIPDAVARLADAMRKTQAPDNCSLGKLTLLLPQGDPMFSKAQLSARRDAVLQALDRQGVKVAGRLFVEEFLFERFLADPRGGDAIYDAARDEKPPALKTNSTPRKGSKVKAGDQIKVTMTARDDADRWQSGIKTIQLVAESEGGRFVASENYEACAEPRERRVEATYTVPSNPPPIVRLAALAEDHTGLMDTDVGEFPTGDVWKGTVKLERDGANPQCSAITSESEFTIAVAGDGTVSGSGTLHHSSWTCEGGYTAPATRGTIKLGGKKRDGVFTIFLNDWNPKNAFMPRVPGGHWIVQVGQGSTGEGTFTYGMPDVVFRVKLECQTCGRP